VFEAADRPLCVAVANDGQWRRFCEVMGPEGLFDDPLFATNGDRLRHRDQLRKVLEKTFVERPAAEWLEALNAHAVPCAPINSVADAYADPHVRARSLTAAVPLREGGRVVDLPTIPPQNWDAFGINASPAPTLGQHTQEVMDELGFTDQEVAALCDAGVVR
jgi:crotonobetainyl-CoA:carnitine CoA-transferase CaiB-like acyl-CoA transferase